MIGKYFQKVLMKLLSRINELKLLNEEVYKLMKDLCFQVNRFVDVEYLLNTYFYSPKQVFLHGDIFYKSGRNLNETMADW